MSLPPDPAAGGMPVPAALVALLEMALHTPSGPSTLPPWLDARPGPRPPPPQELEANPNAVCPTCPICKKSLGDYSRHWAELDRQASEQGTAS